MIAIGCDHGGYELKEAVKAHLSETGVKFTDCGCFDTQSVNYPVYAKKVAGMVADGSCEKGILICSTGIGIAIAANKVKGIRAALCHDSYSAKMTRLHNDANILCMGGQVIGKNLAFDIVDVFLNTAFSGEERHKKRIEMIESDVT